MSNLIDVHRVTEKTTLGRTTVYTYVKEGKFPGPIRVGARQVAWIESEIDDWIKNRIAESRPGQVEEVAA